MKTKHVIYALLALTFLLGACSPKQAATPDQNAIRQEIETSVALTVSAGEALTAAAQPVFTDTVAPPANTPFPTLTPFATITPFMITPGSGGSGSSGSGSGSGGTVYYGGEQCGNDPKYMGAIIDQIPHDGSPETIRKTGESPEKLDVVWTIKNVGTKTWLPTWAWMVDSETVNSDVPANKLLSLNPAAFTPVAFGPGPLPIGDTIEPGEFISLSVQMTMPLDFDGPKPIFFTVQMAFVGEAGYKFCRPWIQIELIRPGMTP
jgi:hypothetical protein